MLILVGTLISKTTKLLLSKLFLMKKRDKETKTLFNPHDEILCLVIGVQQTYHQFHHENVPWIFTPQLSFPAFMGRMLVGLPTILLVKYCSKALAKRTLLMLANALSILIRSTSYIPRLCGSNTSKKSNKTKQAGYALKLAIL